MKKIVTGLFLLNIAGSFAQQDTTFFDKSWKPCKQRAAEYYRIIRAEGSGFLVTDYYRNHVHQMEAFCTKTDTLVKNGKCTFYDRQGRIEKEGMCTDNAETGTWTFRTYFNNGMRYSSGFLKNNRLDSTLSYYYRDGKIYSTEVYVNDTIHGLQTVFRDNGSVRSTSNYAHGKLHGWYTAYRENGSKRYEEEYRNGKTTGNRRLYFKSGQLQGDFFWVERRVNGYKIWYYENGEIQSQVTFKNGKRTKSIRNGQPVN